jgi:hypothetical protein
MAERERERERERENKRKKYVFQMFMLYLLRKGLRAREILPFLKGVLAFPSNIPLSDSTVWPSMI